MCQRKDSILNLKLSDEPVYAFAISKLTFIYNLLDTPKGFTVKVNNIIFDYIWKYTNSKLKKTTVVENKEGGLNMLDLTLFDKVLKIIWVKRLCTNDKRP